MSSSDSSFSSSFSSFFSSAAGAAPPAAGAPPAAAAPPPPPPDGTDASLEVPSLISYNTVSVLLIVVSSVCAHHTSPRSLPSSSEISLSKRSSSASMPTDERTPLTSLAEGEVFPPRPSRRYAARCFIYNLCQCCGHEGRPGRESFAL